jgi:hypothetical protein
VKDEFFKSTLAEAVLISPTISSRLKCDPTNREFCFPTDCVESNLFSIFLDLIRCRARCQISRAHEFDFLRVSKCLGNEDLSFMILHSIHSKDSDRPSEMTKSDDVLLRASFDCDDCASRFSSYSVEELGCLSKDTLHIVLSSDSLVIESEDVLLQQLIDLGGDYFEFWSYVEVSFLSDRGIDQFVENLPFNELCELIWAKIMFRLKGICDDNYRSRRFCLRPTSNQSIFESTIISIVPAPLTRFAGKSWILLYRGTRDGFVGSTFHAKCDGHSNTLTLILTTKGFIFGGFTSISWESKNEYKADNTQQSFVFSLQNAQNIEPKSFSLVKSTHAIYSYPSYGPTF